MSDLNNFLNSRQFVEYSKKNPISAKEITDFLLFFFNTFKGLPGTDLLCNTLVNSTTSKKSPPLKWFNIFSQIRCTYFLLSNGIKVIAVETPKEDKILDFKLNDGKFGDIKSFSTIDQQLTDPNAIDEYVIKRFLEKKVKRAFEEQKADLLIIDDIFSDYSEQYGLLDYFLSFINDSVIDERKKIIQDNLGIYLPKMLYLSFIKSITVNPIKKIVGEKFRNLGL